MKNETKKRPNIAHKLIHTIIILIAALGWITPGFATNISSGPRGSAHSSHAGAHAGKHANHSATHTSAKQINHHSTIVKKSTPKLKITAPAIKTAKKTTQSHPNTTSHTKHTIAAKKRSHTVTHAKRKHPHHSTTHSHPMVLTPNVPVNQMSTTESLENVSSITGKRIVSYVDNLISSIRYTRYRSGGTLFDTMHGICEADCSHYVDHILQKVCPNAYSHLVSSTGAVSPDSKNYYDFFSVLPSRGSQDWDQVDNAKQLQPGDVLVFRYLNGSGISGGHVMMVMDKPTVENNALVVRVSDSAFASHSDDTRRAHSSGVGIGTMLLKINPNTGRPSAYAWDVDSRWQDRVKIAMARPVEMA